MSIVIEWQKDDGTGAVEQVEAQTDINQLEKWVRKQKYLNLFVFSRTNYSLRQMDEY
jgi:hypothetical protein